MTDQRGFTLIEMLVSLSIFAVITSFVIANYRVGQQGDELRISAQLVGSMVRRAQTAAIAGGEIASCVGGAVNGKVCTPGISAACADGDCLRDIPRGYGVHFSSAAGKERTMVYFADTNGDRRFDPQEAVRSESVSSGAFVSVTGVFPDDGSGSLDIVFVPPKPNVLYNAATDETEAVVTLRHRSTGKEQTIRINRVSGQVSVD
jgi:prepilin-type N-terminal cleavage/methylation domain-containing protein